MTCCTLPLLLVLQGVVAPASPADSVRLPSGTPIWVKTEHAVPLHVGQPVTVHLVYPIFAENHLVLPVGTEAHGTITGLQPDHQHRIQSRLRGDFTPFSKPVVQFSELILPDGTRVPLPAGPAVDGAPVMRLTPPPPRKGGFIRHELDNGIAMAKDRLHVITGPDKKDRLKQLLYSQLPYHPQQVQAGTVWAVNTTAPMELAENAPPAPPPVASAAVQPKLKSVSAQQPNPPGTWTLEAYLPEAYTSAKAKVGDPIRAVVAQPVMNAAGAVDVPEGAVLEGEITRARPARRFGRAGVLGFDFRQLTFPGEKAQQVQTDLAGIDADNGNNLALDREGQVKPKPQDKLVVPAILVLLALRPLDEDHGDNGFGKDAVGSNSLGVLGFIVGTAAGYRNLAAGIGFYGSALALWNRWIKRGDETTFRRDTRLVLQTTARHSAPMISPSNPAPAPGH